MGEFVTDLRQVVRGLGKNRAVTLATIVTLTLGIGVNTTVFSLINALLLRPMPGIGAPAELVALFSSQGGAPGVSSYADFRDLRRTATSFAGLAAYKRLPMDLGVDGRPERIAGELVSAEYFQVLGLTPAAGRFFVPAEEESEGGAPVAVLGHALWRSRFGGKSAALGATVELNGHPFTVIGVAPAGFCGASLMGVPQVFVPFSNQPRFMPRDGDLRHARGWSGVYLVGRLAPGRALAVAQAEADALMADLRRTYPDEAGDRSLLLLPFERASLAPQLRATVTSYGALFFFIGALALATACVNVATLMLAKNLGRRRELAVRAALGASRARLARLLLLEGLALAAAGGLLALLASLWTSDLLRTALAEVAPNFAVDGRQLAWTALVALTSGLLFALGPALLLSRTPTASFLREQGQRQGEPGRGRFSRFLVVAQVAVSVVLLATAALFVRRVAELTRSVGFEVEGRFVAEVDPGLEGYDAAATRELLLGWLDRLRATAGIEAASLTTALPGGGFDQLGVHLRGEPKTAPWLRLAAVSVEADLFTTLGIETLAGRTFAPREGPEAALALVVNEAAAKLLAERAGRPAVGLALTLTGPDGPFYEVIGVVRDAVIHNLRDGAAPTMFANLRQLPAALLPAEMALVAKSPLAPAAVDAILASTLAQGDARLPLVRRQTLEQRLWGSLIPERAAAGFAGGAAALSLVLAAVGLYGVLAFTVSRRTAELGLRLALGAKVSDLSRMVLGDGLRLALGGLAAGWLIAALLQMPLSRLLAGATLLDPWLLVPVNLALLATGLFACLIPARRAGRVDPLVSIKGE